MLYNSGVIVLVISNQPRGTGFGMNFCRSKRYFDFLSPFSLKERNNFIESRMPGTFQ